MLHRGGYKGGWPLQKGRKKEVKSHSETSLEDPMEEMEKWVKSRREKSSDKEEEEKEEEELISVLDDLQMGSFTHSGSTWSPDSHL